MLCNPLKVNRRFGLIHVGFLPALFFDAEDGGVMFFLNVGWLSADCYIREHKTLQVNKLFTSCGTSRFSYRVHKRRLLHTVVSHLNPAYIFLRSIFILFFRLSLVTPSGLFSPGVATKILFRTNMHAKCRVHHVIFNFIIIIMPVQMITFRIMPFSPFCRCPCRFWL
jgi:hypothetical protein